MNVSQQMRALIAPGETVVLAGKRGGGKTATAVSMVQHAMDGDWGHENVVCITNVLFGRVVGHGHPPVEDYPDGIYHEDTLAGTMRRVGQIIEEYGSGNATIVWLLDEAQNFMLADLNGSKENLALTKYLGNARKFDVCNLFLTPSVNNLTPRVRCFPTGDAKSGYCSARLQKDPAKASKIIGSRGDPRSITWIQTDAEAEPVPVFIKPGAWIRGIYGRGLGVGEFGYDTKSTATFSVGENAAGVAFSFDEFIKATSGGLSHELPGKIADFFSKWDAADGKSDGKDPLPGTDYSRLRIADQMRRIERMRGIVLRSGKTLTWEEIAEIEGENPKTVYARYRKWTNNDKTDSKTTAMPDAYDDSITGAYIKNKKEGPSEAPADGIEGGERWERKHRRSGRGRPKSGPRSRRAGTSAHARRRARSPRRPLLPGAGGRTTAAARARCRSRSRRPASPGRTRRGPRRTKWSATRQRRRGRKMADSDALKKAKEKDKISKIETRIKERELKTKRKEANLKAKEQHGGHGVVVYDKSSSSSKTKKRR